MKITQYAFSINHINGTQNKIAPSFYFVLIILYIFVANQKRLII